MNEFFKAAIKRFKIKESLIAPISEVDAEIIGELIEIFKKLEMTPLINILAKYKYLKDSEILDKVLEFSLKLSSDIYNAKQNIDDEGNPIPIVIRYLLINNRRIDLFQIVGFDVIDDINGGEILYQIKLNPTPDKAKYVPYYSNEILEFKTKESRDELAAKIDMYLVKTRGFFLM